MILSVNGRNAWSVSHNFYAKIKKIHQDFLYLSDALKVHCIFRFNYMCRNHIFTRSSFCITPDGLHCIVDKGTCPCRHHYTDHSRNIHSHVLRTETLFMFVSDRRVSKETNISMSYDTLSNECSTVLSYNFSTQMFSSLGFVSLEITICSWDGTKRLMYECIVACSFRSIVYCLDEL